MPTTKNKPKTEEINPDYIRMYYEHQYDRINKHQEQSLNISNIVLTVSTLIVTFGFSNKQSFGSILILFLPLIIIFANVFAILFIAYGGRWILQHQSRAKKILEIYAPSLFKLDKEFVGPTGRLKMGRKAIQNTIHYVFIVIGIILLILFVIEALGVSIV